MAKEWVGHKQGLDGSIDCTSEERFCTELKLTGLPTILYGEPSQHGVLLQEYGGDKSTSKALSEFANNEISTPFCSPVNLDACENEKDRNQMMYFLSLGIWELESIIKYKQDAIQMARDQFDAGFAKMQAAYDSAGTENEIQKARIKSRIKTLKSILDMRKSNKD